MAAISQLAIYPVKSCAGIALTEATIGRAGLESGGVGDREWMVVNHAGDFLTQRQHPRMALIVPLLEAGVLRLSAPGMDDLLVPLGDFSLRVPDLGVRVWNHACAAFDEGTLASQWLSDYLKMPARLARFDASHARLSNRITTGDVEALNRFSDGYPLLILSDASLAYLNRRLKQAGREPLPMDRFRPNIVINGVEAHDEDRLSALRIADAGGNGAGDIELRPVKPCPRCPIPSIDQRTGEPGPDPLDILARYRGSADGVLFGQNAVVVRGFGARLRVGQRIDEEWNF